MDFFDELPEYSNELYCHKKMKTDEANSLEALKVTLPELEAISDWTYEAIHDALIGLAESLGVKNATLMWPLRIAIAGKTVTPGGAVELCHILGKDEVLRRMEIGVGKLK